MARTCQFKILKTPLDRKRKLEEDYDSQSELENSPSKRKRHSLDFKLKVISELKTSNYSKLATKYKITRSCIQDWKNQKLNMTPTPFTLINTAAAVLKQGIRKCRSNQAAVVLIPLGGRVP